MVLTLSTMLSQPAFAKATAGRQNTLAKRQRTLDVPNVFQSQCFLLSCVVQEEQMMVVVLFALAILIFLAKHHFHFEESFAAVTAHCDAGKAFFDWRFRNPGIYIGLSQEGQKLLADLLESYDWLMRTDRFMKEDGYRDYLVSLFYDLPPKHPDDQGHPEKGVQTNALFFIQETPPEFCLAQR